MLKSGPHLLGEAGELRLELGRRGPKGEAEHQVLQPWIAGLDVLQIVDDLGRRPADPGALLQHVLEVDASGNVPRGPRWPHLSHLLWTIAQHPQRRGKL